MSSESVTFQPFCRSAVTGRQRQIITHREGDISSLRQISTHPPLSKEKNF